MRSQSEKAEAFVALHTRPGAFVIPNPWDAGTAKLLAALGFEALATTSLGLANMLGSAEVSLDAILANCRTIADATDLPVSADLENCGADQPEAAACRLPTGIAATHHHIGS
jgi:2-methylisocitrate lyase-like PEP mutase family enzyme